MLTTYSIFNLRNLLGYKALSFINIFGLSISLVAGLLVFSFVQHKLNKDSAPTEGKRIMLFQQFECVRTVEADLHHWSNYR